MRISIKAMSIIFHSKYYGVMSFCSTLIKTKKFVIPSNQVCSTLKMYQGNSGSHDIYQKKSGCSEPSSKCHQYHVTLKHR